MVDVVGTEAVCHTKLAILVDILDEDQTIRWKTAKRCNSVGTQHFNFIIKNRMGLNRNLLINRYRNRFHTNKIPKENEQIESKEDELL